MLFIASRASACVSSVIAAVAEAPSCEDNGCRRGEPWTEAVPEREAAERASKRLDSIWPRCAEAKARTSPPATTESVSTIPSLSVALPSDTAPGVLTRRPPGSSRASRKAFGVASSRSRPSDRDLLGRRPLLGPCCRRPPSAASAPAPAAADAAAVGEGGGSPARTGGRPGAPLAADATFMDGAPELSLLVLRPRPRALRQASSPIGTAGGSNEGMETARAPERSPAGPARSPEPDRRPEACCSAAAKARRAESELERGGRPSKASPAAAAAAGVGDPDRDEESAGSAGSTGGGRQRLTQLRPLLLPPKPLSSELTKLASLPSEGASAPAHGALHSASKLSSSWAAGPGALELAASEPPA